MVVWLGPAWATYNSRKPHARTVHVLAFGCPRSCLPGDFRSWPFCFPGSGKSSTKLSSKVVWYLPVPSLAFYTLPDLRWCGACILDRGGKGDVKLGNAESLLTETSRCVLWWAKSSHHGETKDYKFKTTNHQHDRHMKDTNKAHYQWDHLRYISS